MKFEYARVHDSLFQQEYLLSRIQEYVEMALYSVIAFSLPFLLGHEQLLVGAAVNCALVLAALNLRGARLLPVIILPSIGAYLAGLIFGVASPALLYMLPFIWAEAVKLTRLAETGASAAQENSTDSSLLFSGITRFGGTVIPTGRPSIARLIGP